jgi:hypothetical protein
VRGARSKKVHHLVDSLGALLGTARTGFGGAPTAEEVAGTAEDRAGTSHRKVREDALAGVLHRSHKGLDTSYKSEVPQFDKINGGMHREDLSVRSQRQLDANGFIQ